MQHVLRHAKASKETRNTSGVFDPLMSLILLAFNEVGASSLKACSEVSIHVGRASFYPAIFMFFERDEGAAITIVG